MNNRDVVDIVERAKEVAHNHADPYPHKVMRFYGISGDPDKLCREFAMIGSLLYDIANELIDTRAERDELKKALSDSIQRENELEADNEQLRIKHMNDIDILSERYEKSCRGC